MKFYNREKELSKLSEIASLSLQKSHMVVISGRRRVGKTELIRRFSEGQKNLLYLFVSKKKPHILLEEFRDLLSERIPMIKAVSFRSFEDFFAFLFSYMKEHRLIIVFDEFQNFEFVDPSVFSIIQKHWDKEKDGIKGAFIFIGSVFTLMQKIFEGKKEPLFGRATSRLYVEPLDPDALTEILFDHHIDPAVHLPFYFTLFGGIPKYYFIADRYHLFGKSQGEIIRRLYCETDAPLQNEGKELLIEEFGKNYHLYFSILQVIAGGETQMARIADGAGINVNSISKYLDELTSYYKVLERRTPVTELKHETKTGRYHIKDPALRFWFRYIFKNQSLIEIGDEKGLTEKILNDLPTFMGSSSEDLIRALLLKRNMEDTLPFKFNRLGGFWTKKGDVEIDIVAINDDEGKVLFGECKLKGGRFTKAEAQRLKEKAEYVKWRIGKRKEYFALFSMDEVSPTQRKALEKERIICFDLKRLLKKTG
jgi:AAA+ ATPase superfamily predicted ATPase